MTPSMRISGANPVFEDSEIVLGLVAPVGTNFHKFHNLLARCLRRHGYAASPIRLSELTTNFEITEDEPSSDGESAGESEEARRLHRLMHAGNKLRFYSRRGEVLALAAAKEIRSKRPSPPDGPVMLKTAHVVRSLKHPDEVRALRRIYGGGFYLIGISVEERQRRLFLQDEQGCTEKDVDALLRRDEHEVDTRYIDEEGNNYGQRTRDTYQLADAFIPIEAEEQLARFLGLLFGCPFETPTADEYAMFLAFGASLRSGDLSRQVGAVMSSHRGDIVGVGANDVPRPGGGLHWPGPKDGRDHALGHDSNERRREEIVAEVLDLLKPDDADSTEWGERGRRRLKEAAIMDITEYGRAVHAEMEALLACARSGTSTRHGTLYSTTFPCHNCAKHIIDAGVRRVVYVEPYPKSQAMALFKDAIVLGSEPGSGRVRFEPFVGIGPRRFFDLFSMGLSSGTTVKRKRSGAKAAWDPSKGLVRVPMLPNSYLEREQVAENELLTLATPPEDS
jgi:deoxycytidylate deaminase